MQFSEYFQGQKRELFAQNQYRSLKPAQGIDFCSNDYLGFAYNADIKSQFLLAMQELPLGSTGSRLIRGENPLIEDLERQLAEMAGAQASLFFATGYQANLALMSALLAKQALVFSDELNHASLIDGMRLAKCEKRIFKHNDLGDLRRQLAAAPKSLMRFVVVESIYSMRGDEAPLCELVELCDEMDAQLIVDEAHATGLYGEQGSGRVEALNLQAKVFARIHTAGKALGAAGAWISGSFELRDFLVNFSRPFIYSTGPSYPQVQLLKCVLNHWPVQARTSFHLQRVDDLRQQLRRCVVPLGYQVFTTSGPIIGLQVNENDVAIEVSTRLAEAGFDARAIRPPTVPPGEAMLRITVPGARSDSEIERFAAAVAEKITEVKR